MVEEIKNEIENTASWTRPNSARKYLNPNISESMREVNQFVRKNQGMKNMPQSKFKVGTTSSRRFVAKPPSNPQVVDSVRSVRELTQSGILFFPGIPHRLPRKSDQQPSLCSTVSQRQSGCEPWPFRQSFGTFSGDKEKSGRYQQCPKRPADYGDEKRAKPG